MTLRFGQTNFRKTKKRKRPCPMTWRRCPPPTHKILLGGVSREALQRGFEIFSLPLKKLKKAKMLQPPSRDMRMWTFIRSLVKGRQNSLVRKSTTHAGEEKKQLHPTPARRTSAASAPWSHLYRSLRDVVCPKPSLVEVKGRVLCAREGWEYPLTFMCLNVACGSVYESGTPWGLWLRKV